MTNGANDSCRHCVHRVRCPRVDCPPVTRTCIVHPMLTRSNRTAWCSTVFDGHSMICCQRATRPEERRADRVSHEGHARSGAARPRRLARRASRRHVNGSPRRAGARDRPSSKTAGGRHQRSRDGGDRREVRANARRTGGRAPTKARARRKPSWSLPSATSRRCRRSSRRWWRARPCAPRRRDRSATPSLGRDDESARARCVTRSTRSAARVARRSRG